MNKKGFVLKVILVVSLLSFSVLVNRCSVYNAFGDTPCQYINMVLTLKQAVASSTRVLSTIIGLHTNNTTFSHHTMDSTLLQISFCPQVETGANELRQFGEYCMKTLGIDVQEHRQNVLNNNTLKIMMGMTKIIPPGIHQRKGDLMTNIKFNFILPYIMKYSYKVKESMDIEISFTNRQFGLEIEETFLGAPTKGGSSIKVITESEQFTDRCSVYDHFNGKYSICCNIRGLYTNVTAFLMFTNFTAFMRLPNLRDLNRIIFTRTICMDGISMPAFNMTESTNMMLNHVDLTHNIMNESKHSTTLPFYHTGNVWFKSNDTWYYAENGTSFPKPDKSNVEKCLSGLNSLLFIGDSHTRLYFIYIASIVKELKMLPSPKYNYRYFRNVIYNSSTYYSSLVQSMNILLQDTGMSTSTLPDVIVLNTGAWDTAFTNLETLLFGMHDVFTALSRLKTHRRWRKAQIFWMTVPCFQNHLSEAIYAGTQNNHNRAAANAYVIPHMRRLGVDVIDVYSILNPQNNIVADIIHYMSYNPFAGLISGSMIGGVPVNKLLHSICGDQLYHGMNVTMKDLLNFNFRTTYPSSPLY